MHDSDHTLIIGAGLLGLSSALYLQAAGHRVRILERREDVGLETSFANAGMATPSMSDPWNAPGVHWTLLKYLGRSDAPLLMRPAAIGAYIGWGLRFLRFSAPRRFAASLRANYALSSYSLEQIRALRAELGLQYEARTAGTLTVFRDQSQFEAAVAEQERLSEYGLPFTALDRAETLALEPVLNGNAARIVGAVHHPDDETGDAHLFCQALKKVLLEGGAHIDFGVEVQKLQLGDGAVTGVHTSKGLLACRRLVVAAAGWSPGLLRDAGVRIAVRPVKGYSITAPVTDPALLPRRAIIDHHLHAAATPFEARLRLAGTAEFAGWDRRLDPARIAQLWKLAETISPAMSAAMERDAAVPWCGFRPMAADGNPYIGTTPVKGLYLNTGHGYLGWTQSAGSGKLLAQLITGEAPDIDLRPYAVDRP